MIITCNKCAKKFDVVSTVIPDKGRLLQCNGCNHKWFFKKEVQSEPITSFKTIKPIEKIESSKEEIQRVEIESSKTMEFLDKKVNDELVIKKTTIYNDNINKNEDYKDDKDLKITIPKNKKTFNILSLIIVLIITFIALIIFLDTFKTPIGKIVPNFEFQLYNLYETINDIVLFLKDLV
jgi:predicted Zn finger-like uncharacterized protein